MFENRRQQLVLSMKSVNLSLSIKLEALLAVGHFNTHTDYTADKRDIYGEENTGQGWPETLTSGTALQRAVRQELWINKINVFPLLYGTEGI